MRPPEAIVVERHGQEVHVWDLTMEGEENKRTGIFKNVPIAKRFEQIMNSLRDEEEWSHIDGMELCDVAFDLLKVERDEAESARGLQREPLDKDDFP